jgi:hypothetical protein
MIYIVTNQCALSNGISPMSEKSFEQRQRQTMADYNRSAFRTEPPGFSSASKRLDAIAAADERARQQAKQVELMNAELIAHAKRGEMGPKG